jgi:hypothetical protein
MKRSVIKDKAHSPTRSFCEGSPPKTKNPCFRNFGTARVLKIQ